MKQIIKLILISAFFISSASSFAQGLAVGIEAAVTTSSVKITEIKDTALSAMKGDGIMGYEAGIFLRFKVSVLYVKPKILFHYEEGKLNYTMNGVDQSVTFSSGKILIPVLIGYKFLPPVLSLEAGPVFNYDAFATKSFKGTDVDIQKSGIGYRIGLNAEIKIINLTISYQGVKNNGSSSSLASYQAPNAFVFGLGVKF